MTSPTTAERAHIAQVSLDHYWGAPPPQLYANAYPADADDDSTFNYWWLAHLVDARLDAFERTGDPVWRDRARAVFANIVERNGGSLFNDYFDDMLWLGLAALRLAELGGGGEYRAAAIELWEHVVEHGWNDLGGTSLAWRKQQPYYKNTPANGPLVILSLRLARVTGDDRYRPYATTAFDWLTDVLVDADSGFVEDGINREQDGAIDTQWRFTYNQGLYLGAAVELAHATGDPAYLAAARRTARAAVTELSDGTVFVDEGEGGDEGLFKGVYFRYLRTLLPHLDGAERAEHEDFVLRGCDELWASCFDGEHLLANDDWHAPASGPVRFSTQLSAIMALELAAWIERSRAASAAGQGAAVD